MALLLFLLQAGFQSGTLPVGFVLLSLADSTRRMPSGEPRPVAVGVWYPARATDAPHLTYRQYFSLPAETGGRELDEFVAFLGSHGAPAEAVQQWLGAPMLAARNAPASGGRFPLVLLAQGNGQTLRDQAPLAEYLASHGYVVATSPSPMLITGPLTDEADMARRAEEQADDLAFVRAALRQRSDVAGDRIGVVGHSFGARAALLYEMREHRVAALVSLDGGIGTATGRAGLEAAPSFRRGSARAPVLHFYEPLDTFMTPDLGLLRSLHSADRWLVRVPAMHHHLFTSLGAASMAFPRLRSALAATSATADQYGSVQRATLDFLDGFLKQRPAVQARLRRGEPWPYLDRPEVIRQ
jgi:dienelactone hydrolase